MKENRKTIQTDTNNMVGKLEFERRLKAIKRSGQTGFILLNGLPEDEKMINDEVYKVIRRIDNMTKIDDGKILLMLTNLQGADNVTKIVERLGVLLTGKNIIISGIYLPYVVLKTEQVVKLLTDITPDEVAEYPNPFCVSEKGAKCLLSDNKGRCRMLEEFNKYISIKATDKIKMIGTIKKE